MYVSPPPLPAGLSDDTRNSIARRYRDLFAGSLRAYQHQPDGIQGLRPRCRHCPSCSNEHCVAGHHWARLTVEVVAQSLESGSPLGLYMLGQDSCTPAAALDFDAADGFEQACATARSFTHAGVPAYVEPSR